MPPGPNNPLGNHALSLGIHNLVIHGTNRPYSIGKRSSHGCIRLYPEDIAQLFKEVETGTQVTIIDTPYKLGWLNDTLFLEISATQQQADIIARSKIPEPADMPELHDYIISKAGEGANIDWDAVSEAIRLRNGIPIAIAKKIKGI